MYDLIIIGAGPAGVAAGVYASRKQLKTLFITKDWGGQSIVSPDIQNWIGTPSISGDQLAKSLEEHLRTYADKWVEILDGVLVTKIEKNEDEITVTLDSNESHKAQSVLIASGSSRRKLEVKGAAEFENKGLTYCATCDGPLFAGQSVAVIGGGNAAFETAAQLLAYTKQVTLFNRSERYRADPVTVEKVLANKNITGLTNVSLTEITGDKFVSGINYRNTETNKEDKLPVTGIFVEIGLIPNTNLASNLLELDEYKRIIIDPWTGQTSVPGIWAAGDCTNIKYHQNNISAGNGVTALEDIYIHLKTK